MKRAFHEYLNYVFTISAGPVEPIFTVVFVDFPEIITSGESLAEAFANACEALELHLETLRKLGGRVPRPAYRLRIEAR